ncbi:MAG TPA: acyl-CoA dehydrogenase family protein [Candidatus Xenobia bacterium]|jgi:alkylation response protein AidB-like acyl-CoA dehydrogenase
MLDLLDERQQRLTNHLQEMLNEHLPELDRMDETDEFSWPMAERLWEAGVLSLMLPPEHGGDPRITSLCCAVETIARFSGGLALLAVVQGTGTLPVMLMGNAGQRERYARSISGRRCIAFALSETRAGSDARSIDTRIVDKGDHFEVSGSKWFVTNGGIAEHYVIFGRRMQDGEEQGYTTVVIDKGTPGFTITPKNDLFGMRGTPTTSLIMRRVKVPRENELAGDGGDGDGFKLAMRTLDRSRPAIGAQAVGLAQAALDITVNHCRKRQVFGKALGKLDGVKMMLADMSVAIDASRLLVSRAAHAVDANHPDATQFSAGAKFFATDTAMKVSVDAIQLMGGYGCFRGRTLDRIMRDAKITQIYEGANQIQRLVVGRDLLARKHRTSHVLGREDKHSAELLAVGER